MEENSTKNEDKKDYQAKKQSNDKKSEVEKSEKDAFEKEKYFEPIVKTEDKLHPKNSTNLAIINTYFTCINTRFR